MKKFGKKIFGIISTFLFISMIFFPTINSKIISIEKNPFENKNIKNSLSNQGELIEVHSCKFKEYKIFENIAVYKIEFTLMHYIPYESIGYYVDIQIKNGEGEDDYRTINLGRYSVDANHYFPIAGGYRRVTEEINILSSDLESIDEERFFAGSTVYVRLFDNKKNFLKSESTVANYWHKINSPDDNVTSSQIEATKPMEKWMENQTFSNTIEDENPYLYKEGDKIFINWDALPEEESNEFKDLLINKLDYENVDCLTEFEFVNFKNNFLSMNIPKFKQIYSGDVLENMIPCQRMGYVGTVAKYLSNITALFLSIVASIGVGATCVSLLGLCIVVLIEFLLGIWYCPGFEVYYLLIIITYFIILSGAILTYTIIEPAVRIFEQANELKAYLQKEPWKNDISLFVTVNNIRKGDEITISCNGENHYYNVESETQGKWGERINIPTSDKNNPALRHKCQIFIEVNGEKKIKREKYEDKSLSILSYAFSDGSFDWTFDLPDEFEKAKSREISFIQQEYFQKFPKIYHIILNLLRFNI